MRKYSKLFAILIAVAMILPGVAQAALVETTTNGIDVHRLGGTDRVGTAILASQTAYPSGTSAVVLAGYNGEVDALTGTLLAADKDAPLLITVKGQLTDRTKDEIVRLGANTVYILGGTSVVSMAVETTLQGLGKTVVRVDGSNRDATAVNVAKKVKGNSADDVFLALGRPTNAGDALADALAIGPVSAMKDMPVLLTRSNEIPVETLAAMSDLDVKRVTIIGGTTAIKPAVASMLQAAGYTVNRIGESGREETALKIAQTYFTNPSKLIVAYGRKSADALVGGYLGNKMNAPILLTHSGGLTANTAAYITANPLETYVLGGTSVITNAVLQQIVAALEGATSDLTAYNSALAAVMEANYTPSSWLAYQAIVGANVVTSSDSQIDVDAAVAAIVAAQSALVEKLFVKSVTPKSATQVEIKFNKEIDKSTLFTNSVSGAFVASTIVMNTLDSVPSGALTGMLSMDGKTLTVTSANPLSMRYNLAVSGLQSVDGENLVAYSEVVNIAADATAPKVIATDRISANKLKIRLSEPVMGGSITAKYADGTTISPALTLALSADGMEVDVDLSNPGVTVSKDIVITFNGVADMAGNLIDPQPTQVTVVKNPLDGVLPVINTVTQTGAKTFNIKFNKDLNGALATAFNAGDVTVTGAGATVGIVEIAPDEYEVTTTNNLSGLQTVTVAAGKAVDLSGQANAAALTKLKTFTEDTVAPVATSQIVRVNNQEYIQLTFDKDVNLKGTKEVTIAGTKISNSVTTTVASTDVIVKYENMSNKKIVLVPLTNPALAVEGAVYSVTLANKTAGDGIESLSGVDMNSMNLSFTRGQDSATANSYVVSAIAVAQGTTPDDVNITFTIPAGESLDGPSALNLSNYSIAGATIESVTLLPASGTTQVAKLKLAANSNTFTGVRNITVQNVKVTGSTAVMTPKTVTNVSLLENVKPTVLSAILTTPSQVKVIFSEPVAAFAGTTDFELRIGGVKVAANDQVTTLSGSGTTIMFNLEAPVTASDLTSGLSLKALTTINLKDINGNNVSVPSNITVTQ